MMANASPRSGVMMMRHDLADHLQTPRTRSMQRLQPSTWAASFRLHVTDVDNGNLSLAGNLPPGAVGVLPPDAKTPAPPGKSPSVHFISLSPLRSGHSSGCCSGLSADFPTTAVNTPCSVRSSMRFTGRLSGGNKAVVNLLPLPRDSSVVDGPHYQLYKDRFATLAGLTEEQVEGLMPASRKDWEYGPDDPDWAGFGGVSGRPKRLTGWPTLCRRGVESRPSRRWTFRMPLTSRSANCRRPVRKFQTTALLCPQEDHLQDAGANTIMSDEVNPEIRASPASDERPYSKSNVHRHGGRVEHACRYC